MRWFRRRKKIFGSNVSNAINSVDALRETEKCIFYYENKNGMGHEVRESKNSSYAEYHVSFQDAKNALVGRCESRVKSLEKELQTARKRLENARGLTKDDVQPHDGRQW